MLRISTVCALLICVAAASYLLGCSNGAIIASNLFYHDDVRRHGSGNAGLTNFYRTYGAKYALCVIAVDMLKAAAAVWLGRELLGGILGCLILGKYFAALFCVIGHMFPAFYAFKGGKGILCSATLLLCLDWRIALVCWGLFLVLCFATRYVSLGSVSAAAGFPILTQIIYNDYYLTVFSVLIAGLVIYAHRQNIVRLLQGTESKFHFHMNNFEEKP
ncbi:MAG: glycerol-3-phosphate 1-O-acyltransferase PlsY [Eubacteriales bacterium]|nr:glycerol-3-phosphate 1-O-acyltransferase PlsY [Eubacteriales bacterium]